VDDAGRLVGIVTDRDLHGAFVAPAVAERLSARGRRRLRALEEIPETLRVRDVMTWGCITTTADAPLAQAAARMTEGRFGALVVVEHGRLVGILTRHDVLRALARLLPSIKGDADDYFW
jgi:CBS domain-containing protein